MTTTDVLIFVEDPGAANYIAQLPTALEQSGYRVRLVADGSAIDYLRQWDLQVEPLQPQTTADQILDQAAPALLIVGTSENADTLGLPLIQQARLRQIPTVSVIDALCNAHHRFRGRSDAPLTYAPDWLLVPDPWTRDAYIELGYPADRIVICGHPHYDYVYATAARLAAQDPLALRQAILPKAPSDRPVVVFAAEVSDGCFDPELFQYSSEYTLTGRGLNIKRTEIVIEEFLDAIALLDPRPYLVLRLHPKNTVEEFTQYLEEFDQVSMGGSPLDLVYTADLTVGMTSMLLLEATLMGKPVLSILPRQQEKDTLLYLRLDLMPCVSTRGSLRSALHQLTDPDDLKSSVQKRYEKNQEYFRAGSQAKLVQFIQEQFSGGHL